MPITHIHKVTTTIGKAINYGKADKIEKDISKDDIADTINYAKNDKTGEVVFQTFSSYHNSISNGEDFVAECRELLERYPRKREVRENEEPALLYHLVQGFDGYIPPVLANQIGREFSQEFLGRYLVQISTHTNTENIHNHIIFCAVNKDGDRYDDCDASLAELRKVSDRICEKYGLNILEGTREYKPIHWVDENGKRHSFEPTQRKRDMIEKRKNEEISTDDISSYRNFEQYEKSQLEKKTQKDIIVDDIKTYLPMANDYEHLLAMLRENLGYTIKDKKKDGDYLEHIVFTHPLYSKGVRDTSLDKDGFFTRKNLEKIIKENVIEKQYNTNEIEELQQESHGDNEFYDYSNVPYFSSYDYDKFDLSAIDENKRAWKKADGSMVVFKRGEPEKDVIYSAKNIENDSVEKLKTFGYEKWQGIYVLRHAMEEGVKERFNMKDEHFSYSQERARAIQERLNCLKFIEEHNLYDYKKVNSIVEILWNDYISAYDNLNRAGERLEKVKFLYSLPSKIEQIEKRIKDNSNNKEYIDNELDHDKMSLDKYKSYLSNIDPKRILNLEKEIVVWEQKYSELLKLLENKKGNLSDGENAIEILKVSVRGSREEFSHTWSEYSAIQANGKEKENENEKIRRKHEMNKNNKKSSPEL